MNQDLIAPGRPGQLYARMTTAIAVCYSTDDCKEIATQAAAVAAYFKQIKDDESVRKFLSVKVRAWRRIAEIFCTVDQSDCENRQAYINKIHGIYPDFTYNQISQAISLAQVPDEFFEQAVNNARSIPDVMTAWAQKQWEDSPSGKAYRERKPRQPNEADKKAAEFSRSINDLVANYNEALDEVGFTMDRRDRLKMKSVVLLIREDVHVALRQSAFDHKMTMQAVLRAGLMMWFDANGYDTDYLQPARKPKRPNKGSDDSAGATL